MTGHYDLTDSAQRDIGGIIDYLTDQNPDAARRLYERLLGAFEQLADLPGMGRLHDGRKPDLRRWRVGSYLVFYRETDDGIEIVRLIHRRRNLDDLL